MATVINSLDRSVSHSNRTKGIVSILIKSLIAGMIGYLIFLLTLILTYPILLKHFGIGIGQISGEDLLVSTFGFLILYTSYVIKETKNFKELKKH